MAVAGVLALASIGGMASPAIASEASYVRTAYDGTIWEIGDGNVIRLSYQDWRDRGFPSWSTARTSYVSVLSMPTVYARTDFGVAGYDAFIQPITFPQFRAAGGPRVSKVSWMGGIEIVRWSTASDLIAHDTNGYTHKLTLAQWRAAGSPPYTERPNRGFVTMSWDDTGAIAYMCNIAEGRGGRVTHDEWSALGSPTPQRVTQLTSDWVFSYPRSTSPRPSWWPPAKQSPDLFYRGAAYLGYTSGDSSYRRLTFEEWKRMGAPAPHIGAGAIGGIYPDCRHDDPTPWE